MAYSILLVDDDRTLQAMVSYLLQSSGFDVSNARTGLDAVRLLEQGRFDAIVTDLMMPDMDGLELIRKVRAENDTTIIVAISGGGAGRAPNYLHHAKIFGADLVLPKPVDAKRLIAMLLQALEVPASTLRQSAPDPA